jgi:hypothetical protein
MCFSFIQNIILLGLVISFHPSQAQDVMLPQDETGHIVFYEVVEADSFTQEELLDNAQEFARKTLGKKKIKPVLTDTAGSILVKDASFKVYEKMITKRIDGIIHYIFKVEVKDGKYRYFFSDFTFQPYERNRYGKFEPVSGKYKPLEEDFKGNRKSWEDHKETVATVIQSQIEELKLTMQYRRENMTRKYEKKPVNNW